MSKPGNFLQEHAEQVFILVVLLTVVVLNYVLENKLAFLQFYFLPVIVVGNLAGIRTAVLGSFFCILMVLLYTVVYPHEFLMSPTREALVVYLLAWGGFLILSGYAVGKQRDRLMSEVDRAQGLTTELSSSLVELKNTKETTILGLAKLAECRDEDTGKHLERIMEYSRVIASELALHHPYNAYITEHYVEDLCLSSILHDIGKVGIPDSILQKPGKLEPEEFEAMKMHTTLGGDALSAMEERIEGRSFLALGKEVAYHHHERWDGNGYPNKLKGDEIPLSARIISVADTYDAITSKRVYSNARPHHVAVDIIREERGTQFDPRIVDVFLSQQNAIGELAKVMN